MVLTTYANSNGSRQAAHPHNLARAFAICSHYKGNRRKFRTKDQRFACAFERSQAAKSLASFFSCVSSFAIYDIWKMLFTTTKSPRDKTNKMTLRLAKTQISLGIRPVRSESSLCTQWVAKDPGFLHADSEDSDQTGRMPRLIWVFAGRTYTLLVLSWGSSTVTADIGETDTVGIW